MTNAERRALWGALVLAIIAAVLGGVSCYQVSGANSSGKRLTTWTGEVQKWDQHVYDCHSTHGTPCPTPTDHIPPPPPPPEW
jgi:hypothetical protein